MLVESLCKTELHQKNYIEASGIISGTVFAHIREDLDSIYNTTKGKRKEKKLERANV